MGLVGPCEGAAHVVPAEAIGQERVPGDEEVVAVVDETQLADGRVDHERRDEDERCDEQTPAFR